MSIPNTSDGFCGDKCKREFRGYTDVKNLDPHACFNLIAAAIEQMFIGQRSRDKQMTDINKQFISGPIVSCWADCSDNFNQERLIKYYDRFTSI